MKWEIKPIEVELIRIPGDLRTENSDPTKRTEDNATIIVKW